MNRDKFYRAYLKMLMEAERWWKDDDSHFDEVNKLAHIGHPADEIHEDLQSRMGRWYYANSLQNWYMHGGEAPTNQYLRKLAHVALNKPQNVRHPEIEGVHVHESLIHKDAVEWFHRVSKHTKEAMKNEPNHFVVYRGVGLPKGNNRYVPNTIESWTTHQPSAEAFMSKSHLPNVEPRLYRGVIHKNDVFASHLSNFGITPSEDSLVGKEEHIVFGHALTNLERIK